MKHNTGSTIEFKKKNNTKNFKSKKLGGTLHVVDIESQETKKYIALPIAIT